MSIELVVPHRGNDLHIPWHPFENYARVLREHDWVIQISERVHEAPQEILVHVFSSVQSHQTEVPSHVGVWPLHVPVVCVGHDVTDELDHVEWHTGAGQVPDCIDGGHVQDVRNLVDLYPVELLDHEIVTTAETGLDVSDLHTQVVRDLCSIVRRVAIPIHDDQISGQLTEQITQDRLRVLPVTAIQADMDRATRVFNDLFG